MEDTPQLFIDKLVEVMRELKRVLKPTGCIFLNLGDSYYSKSGSGQGNNFVERHEQLSQGRELLSNAHTQLRGKYRTSWLQPKQKLLIPHRIAIRCQDELGLILRNDLTWVKSYTNWKTKESWGSAMPTSVSDRFNTTSEYVFFFTKNDDYYFDLDSVRIPHKQESIERACRGTSENNKYYANEQGAMQFTAEYQGYDDMEGKLERGEFRMLNPKGKNPGSCIMFPFEPSREEHFASYPTSLPDLFIRAGCPPDGLVLDPFMGTGTTAYVAKHLRRNYLGIELNDEYIKIIKKKLAQQILPF